MLYFTADLHLNHRNIIKYCHRTEFLSDIEKSEICTNPAFKASFESLARMNIGIIDNINKRVAENDVLYILGDFCFPYKRSLAEAYNLYIRQINCKNIHLILGNHDCRGTIGAQFSSVNDTLLLNQKYWLSHYAHVVWPNSHRGVINLYGHSHATLEDTMDNLFPGRRSLDVGIDNAKVILGDYIPFSEKDIENIVGIKKKVVSDRHV